MQFNKCLRFEGSVIAWFVANSQNGYTYTVGLAILLYDIMYTCVGKGQVSGKGSWYGMVWSAGATGKR